MQMRCTIPDGEKVWISQYNVTIGNWCEYFTKFPCKSPFFEYRRWRRWREKTAGKMSGSSNWKNNCGEFLYLDCKGTRKANIAELYTSSACIQKLVILGIVNWNLAKKRSSQKIKELIRDYKTDEMKWNQARALLQWVKGVKAAILKDENERFITGNVGNNNTANGPTAIVSIPACTQKSPSANGKSLAIAVLVLLIPLSCLAIIA